MWQPIETAPNDGRRVDLWIQAPPKALVAESCGRVTDAWFCNGKWWICDDLGDEFGRSEVHNATHWMPIPEPPKD